MLTSLPALEEQVYYRSSRAKYREIVSALVDLPVENCLEVGTSELGFLLKELNPEWKMDTLDLGDGMEARARARGIRFFEANLLGPTLSVPNNHYDTILFSEVVEHLQGNPHQAFRNLAEALAPGGRIIITTPNLVRLTSRLRVLLGRTPLERIGSSPGWGGHFREYVLPELVHFCVGAGLEVVRADRPMYWDEPQHYLAAGRRGHDSRGKFYYQPYFRGWKRPLGHLAAQLVSRIARSRPGLRQSLFVVARKPFG